MLKPLLILVAVVVIGAAGSWAASFLQAPAKVVPAAYYECPKCKATCRAESYSVFFYCQECGFSRPVGMGTRIN